MANAQSIADIQALTARYAQAADRRDVAMLLSTLTADAEVIIGAITDATLDGKIRVSIVATSLDGQHPEAKSVINMVHRIQNRNPGYSEFQNSDSHQSFNFSANVTAPISELSLIHI